MAWSPHDARTAAAGRKGEPPMHQSPEQEGVVSFHDFVENVTVKKEVDDATGLLGTVVLETKEDLHPQIIITDDAHKSEVLASYPIPSGAHIVVGEGDKIVAGTLMAKTPRKTSKTRDITGGLPRVAELFEARRPKDAAEIAKIDGVVEIGGTVRGKRKLILKDPDELARTENHPSWSHMYKMMFAAQVG
jgi:DNA-directed RNA polymerase subunit beta'